MINRNLDVTEGILVLMEMDADYRADIVIVGYFLQYTVCRTTRPVFDHPHSKKHFLKYLIGIS